jgi:two-component system, chemotaxis family, CheB/CheR fusion protein
MTLSEKPTPSSPSPEQPNYLVGIGASAGGLEALQAFFKGLQRGTGAAFVVIQHLSPDHKSLMVELLSRHTGLEVVQATDDVTPRPDHVYLLPPKYNMEVQAGRLRLLPIEMRHGLNLPVDRLLTSLANEMGARSVAVILSGAGSDGTRGIRTIKEAGGLVMVQDEQSAKFAGMPGSAIATGLADYILPAAEIARELLAYMQHAGPRVLAGDAHELPAGRAGSAMERVLQIVKVRTGLDFSLYKQNTLVRRIERRFSMAQVSAYEDYVDVLESQPREVEQLAKDLLINVTRFFRDPEVFTLLGERVIPELVARTPERGTLRVWCVACASGEEAYSLAMLIEEAIRSKSRAIEYKVFATDLDRDSIEFAARGMYPASIAADVPPYLLERYMIRTGDMFQICREVRERVVFARQNVLKDPPFTKIDFVSCRNLMIYLQPVAQRKALSLFYFGLNPHAVLMLGQSETVGELSAAFEPIDPMLRIFQRRDGIRLALNDALTVPSLLGSVPSYTHELRTASERAHLRFWDDVRDDLLARYAPSGVLVNEKIEVVHSFGKPLPFLRLAPGRASTSLARMLPKELATAVSTACHRARQDHATISYKGIAFTDMDQPQVTDVVVHPTVNEDVYPHALVVMFRSTYTHPELQGPGASPGEETTPPDDATAKMLRQRVADLERDLSDTRISLQAALEDRETTNEELQASNEELLSANEELQSTNEELESVNEELYTVNAEYQSKIQELLQLNDDLDNFLQSTDIGVIFLDGAECIRKFTPAVTREISLLPSDVGRPLRDLGHPMVVQMLGAIEQSRRNADGTAEMQVLGHQGRNYLLQVRPFRRHLATNQGMVVTFVDVTQLGAHAP